MEKFSEEILKKYVEERRFCPHCNSTHFTNIGDRDVAFREVIDYFRCNDCHKCWLEHSGIKEIAPVEPLECAKYADKFPYDDYGLLPEEPPLEDDECQDPAEYDFEGQGSEHDALSKSLAQDPFKSDDPFECDDRESTLERANKVKKIVPSDPFGGNDC